MLSHLKSHQEQSQETRSAVERLQSCLDRIAEREAIVGAWESLHPEKALQQAEMYDLMRSTRQSPGILHGMPIGIKDTFAAIDLPTRWGTPIHHEQVFDYDAAVVERLRSAGAIILGKTVTSEYAIARPGKTRNPHNPHHTPGASSSGSAAAVADGMVPVAIGTQMVGSILRPAAYCGVLGFKPSFGLISRYGLMPSSRELDQVGLFARSLADLTSVFSILVGADPRDPDCHGILAAPNFMLDPHNNPPKFALVLTPHWHKIESEAKGALYGSVDKFVHAGAIVIEINLPSEFDTYFDHIDVLSVAGVAAHHGNDYDRHSEQMSDRLCQIMERGRSLSAIDCVKAVQATKNYQVQLSQILSQFDAILTPVTTGTAPHGFDNTGSPIFCALWTLCGLPAINIPVGQASNGLPLGIQLVGQRSRDWDLLAIADWAMSCLQF